jgi:E3 ubiquitin-protein ligase HERC4
LSIATNLELITALENYSITQVACGNRHSMAINEWGQLFTWGCDEYGQLGQEVSTIQPTPKLVKSLATKHIVQIACGQFHCLVLLNSEFKMADARD